MKKRKRKRWTGAVSTAALFLLATGGCAFFSLTLEVEVLIPPGPWEEAGVPVFHVLRYPSATGEGVETLRVPAGTDRVVILLPRGTTVPVCAYPLGRLTPSGGLLGSMAETRPFRRPVLELTERAGAGAELFLGLLRERERCKTVAFDSLLEAMEKKGEGDPWSCDMDRIRQSILTGSLGLLQVRKLERFSCSLTLPSEEWVAGNRLFKGTFTSAGGSSGQRSLEFSGLYPGVHRFYSPRTGLELHIYVEKNGDCLSRVGSLQDFETSF